MHAIAGQLIQIRSYTTWRDFIVADGAIAAERFCTGSCGALVWRYFIEDHLGSTAALSDQAHPLPVVERDSYDAWGKRRNPNGSDDATCSLTSATSRGFTGQEMLDAVCLINMNARLYDPSLGRFLSADSIVPNPLAGQSFNRFSYVENTPLNAIDPSGMGWFKFAHRGIVIL